MRSFVLVTALAAVLAYAAEPEMAEPGQLAMLLGEDDFEEYLERWLEVEEPKWANVSTTSQPRSGNYF